MADDINKVVLVGGLTRDSELSYTKAGYPVCKLSIAVNTKKKQGDQWIDEANFFDVTIWGKRGEALNQYLTKGAQIAIEGKLKQDRWEQDGMKRSKVTINADNIQLLGGKRDSQGFQQGQGGHNQNGSIDHSQQQGGQQSFQSYTPPPKQENQHRDDYEDDIPF